ncbi:unnamed protein product, partial [Didymodactylos carnosus]
PIVFDDDKNSLSVSYFYHLFQTCAYTIMAVLIMRLKLFLTPQLCLLTSLVMNKHFWPSEYSNYPQEQMMLWINDNTHNESIFSGIMPTMANLKLSTRRPIVLHPHYEHAKIRRRVKLMYSMFSRKPLKRIYQILKNYNVTYYVYERHWCTIENRPLGCSFPEMYDLDDIENRRNELTCKQLERQSMPYFKPVFNYDYITIYQVM